jgi:hypothetical protein
LKKRSVSDDFEHDYELRTPLKKNTHKESARADAKAVRDREPAKPFYSAAHGKIFLGDSLSLFPEIVPNESVDLIMTSPPFGLVRKKDYGNADADEFPANQPVRFISTSCCSCCAKIWGSIWLKSSSGGIHPNYHRLRSGSPFVEFGAKMLSIAFGGFQKLRGRELATAECWQLTASRCTTLSRMDTTLNSGPVVTTSVRSSARTTE